MHEVIPKTRIEREAHAAAAAGHSVNHACPYPFGSAAATHFKAVYLLALPRSADSPAAASTPQRTA